MAIPSIESFYMFTFLFLTLWRLWDLKDSVIRMVTLWTQDDKLC
jgi:hypothetical protein